MDKSANAGKQTKTTATDGRRSIIAVARDDRETIDSIELREIAFTDSHSLRQPVFAFFLNVLTKTVESTILSANVECFGDFVRDYRDAPAEEASSAIFQHHVVPRRAARLQ